MLPSLALMTIVDNKQYIKDHLSDFYNGWELLPPFIIVTCLVSIYQFYYCPYL